MRCISVETKATLQFSEKISYSRVYSTYFSPATASNVTTVHRHLPWRFACCYDTRRQIHSTLKLINSVFSIKEDLPVLLMICVLRSLEMYQINWRHFPWQSANHWRVRWTRVGSKNFNYLFRKLTTHKSFKFLDLSKLKALLWCLHKPQTSHGASGRCRVSLRATEQ